MIINNDFVGLKTIIYTKDSEPITVNHDVELNCEDTAFFCAVHVLESIKCISFVIPQEEREDFYKIIWEKIQRF